MRRIIIVACLLLGAAAIAGVARPEGSHAADPPSAAAATRTITVTGTGSVTSTPTQAQVSFGVQVQAATAAAAIAQDATAMRKVLAALDDAGAKDVATEFVSLSPVYGDDQSLKGFQASNTVTATVTYAAAGSTIDKAVAAGANQVNGPTPAAADSSELYRKALAAAVADAKQHAEALATAAGATLGGVQSVTENGSAPVPFAVEKAAGAADSTPVVAGPQETTATVSVTYALS